MWDKYFGDCNDLLKESNKDVKPENSIKVFDTDIGRKLNFQRLAIHHIILAPQSRTSYPHAESLKEEFVYVLKGRPHVWINGHIYHLETGHAVGFPAGTGIAHTFINNSETDIELLVLGERTKKENLCYFPINPELEVSTQIWWHNAPQLALGPHNGLPGAALPNEIGGALPKCVLFCPKHSQSRLFHYPGDNETFGQGFRISNEVDLKALGVWYEILATGRRSAFPHAHTHEEEFIYVLQGRPAVWMNGYIKQLQPGTYAAFPPNTGIAHVIINDTSEPVIYLGVGEAQEFPDEKITYPLNPLRELECKRKGWNWFNVPRLPFGSHSGRPREAFPEHLALVPCDESDVDEVLHIFNSAASYFEKVEGSQPTLKMAQNIIKDIPKKISDKYIKDFLFIELQKEKIGIVDLHVNHPEDGVCYLGLLLISNSKSGKGLGRKCYTLIEDYIIRAHSCKKIRLGVSADNDVSAFWEKLGFLANGNSYEWQGERSKEFEKDI
ncbi:MAG: GNAT family N-acetyltransferase [Oligoflexales bacterium]|nr:GNAT family N-acetyltransferase [Oligoflexales bacterium]